MQNEPPTLNIPSNRRIPAPMAFAGMLWLLAVLGGMALLAQYAGIPGSSAPSPANWPAESLLPHDLVRPTLVMFVHPQCPCSGASMGELARLMARCQGQLSAHVLFLNPPGKKQDWVESDLWKQAVAIPGVNVRTDDAGREAGTFRTETSGQTLLYESDGTLMFQGGITLSRGHHGDNPGSDAILALLRKKLSSPAQTPAFGCSLCGTERSATIIP